MPYLFNRKNIVIFRKLISAVLAAIFSFSMIVRPSEAQLLPNLPAPGQGIWLTPVFQPPILRGMTVHPENPLLFDFIVDRGQDMIGNDLLKIESTKLIKYFLASMTIPDKDAWVNLSPYEKDRIIPDALGQTEMGKTMLEQDYMLKQLAASLTNPDTEFGKKYWEQVNKSLVPSTWSLENANQALGTSHQVPSLTKVWIVPAGATVVEKDGFAYITESKLDVMMEEDYEKKGCMVPGSSCLVNSTQEPGTNHQEPATAVFRSLILPKLIQEVNTGKTFAPTRQVYQSVILAAWYKKALKDSLLGKIYADKNKIEGITTDEKNIKQKVYDQYLNAFKKGVYNIIKEENNGEEIIPRKYFSGGLLLEMTSFGTGGIRYIAGPSVDGFAASAVREVGDDRLAVVVSSATENPVEAKALISPRQLFSALSKSRDVFEWAKIKFLVDFYWALNRFIPSLNTGPNAEMQKIYNRFGNNDYYFSAQGAKIWISMIAKSPDIRSRIIDKIIATNKNKELVLSVGTGTGTMEVEMKDRGVDVAGIEYVPALANTALKKGIKTRVASGNRMPSDFETKFGLVVYPQSIEHLDYDLTFKEAGRVLKPNGKVLIIGSIPDEFTTYFSNRVVKIDEVQYALERNGFSNFQLSIIKGKDSNNYPHQVWVLTAEKTSLASSAADEISHETVIEEKTAGRGSSTVKQIENKLANLAKKQISIRKYAENRMLLALKFSKPEVVENIVTRVTGEEGNNENRGFSTITDEQKRRFKKLFVGPGPEQREGDYYLKAINGITNDPDTRWTDASLDEFMLLMPVIYPGANGKNLIKGYQLRLFSIFDWGQEVFGINGYGGILDQIDLTQRNYLATKTWVEKIKESYGMGQLFKGPLKLQLGISIENISYLEAFYVARSFASLASKELEAQLTNARGGRTGASSGVGKTRAASAPGEANPTGGIDFDPSKLNLQIKRDGHGVPLPLPRQDLENINIKGLYPVILNILPVNATTLPILSQFSVEPDVAFSKS